MRNSLVRASGWWIVAACLPMVAGVACVSPDTFFRDVDGGDPGVAGGPGSGSGGMNGGGTGGRGPGGNGAGGSNVGTGGRTGGGGMTGAGGRTGIGGSGAGGTIVTGPGANLTDGFETGDVAMRWLAPQSSDSTPCGAWSVVADGATNHVYQQGSTACTSSNSSWAAGGIVDWVDMRLQVRVRFGATATTSTKVTIAVRYNDPKSNYFIEYSNDGKMKIRARVAGSTSDVASLDSKLAVPVPSGQWATIGLAVAGGTLSAYVGTDRAAPAVLSGPATGLTNGGIAIGVANGTASFDDVLVTPP